MSILKLILGKDANREHPEEFGKLIATFDESHKYNQFMKKLKRKMILAGIICSLYIIAMSIADYYYDSKGFWPYEIFLPMGILLLAIMVFIHLDTHGMIISIYEKGIHLKGTEMVFHRKLPGNSIRKLPFRDIIGLEYINGHLFFDRKGRKWINPKLPMNEETAHSIQEAFQNFNRLSEEEKQ